jgi:hypothetical protein
MAKKMRIAGMRNTATIHDKAIAANEVTRVTEMRHLRRLRNGIR